MPTIVLKFGGSVLSSEDELPTAVHEIYRWVRRGWRVVAVVSAIGKSTDRLLAQARRFSREPDPACVAALLATGEATSAALVGLALDRAGIPATVLDPDRVKLRTEGPILDSEAIDVDAAAIRKALDAAPVAVLPGFIGRLPDGRPSLLGRGGSDLTALFIAHKIGADRCRLVKDVDGLYDRDPSLPGLPARRFSAITWDEALRLDGRIVQHKAVRFAKSVGLTFEVGTAFAQNATTVGRGPTATDAFAHEPANPIRVGLLGLGTVGLGVYRELAARPTHFTVAGIAVRNIKKHAGEEVPAELLTTDARRVVDSDCDVIVEAIGGLEPAAALIQAALESGKHVVTANKAVIAHRGSALRAIAAERGVTLTYSASVGGGAPILEALARRPDAARPRDASDARTFRAIEGVINGTTNFVLDRLAEGSSFEDAIRLAQAAGFAEADPTTDLDGSDAAHKLAVIAREAFGADLDPAAIDRQGIDAIDPATVRAARAQGRTIRLIASISSVPDGITARVGPVELPIDHPLAGARNEENRVLIHRDGLPSIRIEGKGAGRWPTTESVFADILDAAALLRSAPSATEPAAPFASARSQPVHAA